MQEGRFLKAVKLANAGLKKEALFLFQALLTDNPADERAWLWLVECLPSPDLRVKALETCLRINPEASRAQAVLDALQMDAQFATAEDDQPLIAITAPLVEDHSAIPDAVQPMIAITGGDTPEVIEPPLEDLWVLSGGASVFTVSPELISPDEVAEREARVYDLLPYRVALQDEANPWEELQQAGDRLTQAPVAQRRRILFPFSERFHWTSSPEERQLSIAYSTLALLVVGLLLLLLMGTGSFGY